jgi:hypothetical protein
MEDKLEETNDLKLIHSSLVIDGYCWNRAAYLLKIFINSIRENKTL